MSEIRVTSVVGENGGDRVGLTTGLTVGPLTGTTGIGVTITHQGHAQFAGVCTATNVSAASSVTATTFYGNGANLTGLANGYGVFEVKHGSSAQSIPQTSYTKVEFKTETYDLDGLFDTTTYRYTPQVAGYYYVAFNIILTGQASGYEIYAEIKKNGNSVMKSHSGGSQNYGSLSQADVYGIVQCNGSSDYLDAYVWHNNANSASRSPDVNMTRMLGYLVRRT